MYADWYIHEFLLIDKNENNIEHAYVYLQKASELKPDSVFIWSTMARIDERFFEKSELATEHLSKAEQILNSSKTLSQNDEAVLEAAKGDVLLCRDHISEGLAHFKNASELDPSSFEKLYETALKWANEDETSKEN